jgi:hypothetical protein
MHIDEHGRKIYTGQEALQEWCRRLGEARKLREGKKLHYKTKFQDIPVSIENRKGSVRSGTDDDGEEWRTKMKVPYGYIPGTKGVDGDELDVFVGTSENAAYAYIIHCNTPDGSKFDEDKVMLGFASSKAAKQCFLQHYDDNCFFGGIDAIPMWQFRTKAFVKKHTTKKLVASKGGLSQPNATPTYKAYDRGQTPIAVNLVHSFYSDVLGSKMTHEQIEENIEIDDPDTAIKTKPKKTTEAEGASLQVPSEYFEEKLDTLGRGTDQDMKKSILGHHQDIMPNPEVREPEEHGVQGQRWGVRHARNDGAGQKGFQAKYRNLANDPKTMNMMQVVHRSQPQLNAIAQQQRNRAAKLAQQNQKPPTPEQNHNEALNKLKELGWKVGEAVARLTGQKLFLSTDRKGNHNITTDKEGKALASRPHQPKRRVRTSMRESKKTYYARPLQHYGTDSEESNVDFIREAFPNEGVNFPKTKRHAELGMGYFHKKIDAAKRLVLKPVKGRKLTAGVFSEARHALKNRIPVWAIHKGKMRRVKSVEALINPNKSGQFGRLIFKSKKK